MLQIVIGAEESANGFTYAKWAAGLNAIDRLVRAWRTKTSSLIDDMVDEAIEANRAWTEAARAEATARGIVETPVIGFSAAQMKASIKEGLDWISTARIWLKDVNGLRRPISSAYDGYLHVTAEAVANGETYAQGIARVVDALRASGGVSLADENRTYDIYGLVRRHVIDGWRDTCQNYRDAIGRSLGMDAVEISAHWCCAEDHLPYQGHVYNLAEFEAIQSSLERPLAYGWNCRHMAFPCWHDSTSSYSDAQLERFRRNSEAIVKVNGREMTRYEASQWQRAQERKIREAKLDMQLARRANLPDAANAFKTRAQALYENYVEQSEKVGLRTDERRLRTGVLAS